MDAGIPPVCVSGVGGNPGRRVVHLRDRGQETTTAPDGPQDHRQRVPLVGGPHEQHSLPDTHTKRPTLKHTLSLSLPPTPTPACIDRLTPLPAFNRPLRSGRSAAAGLQFDLPLSATGGRPLAGRAGLSGLGREHLHLLFEGESLRQGTAGRPLVVQLSQPPGAGVPGR